MPRRASHHGEVGQGAAPRRPPAPCTARRTLRSMSALATARCSARLRRWRMPGSRRTSPPVLSCRRRQILPDGPMSRSSSLRTPAASNLQAVRQRERASSDDRPIPLCPGGRATQRHGKAYRPLLWPAWALDDGVGSEHAWHGQGSSTPVNAAYVWTCGYQLTPPQKALSIISELISEQWKHVMGCILLKRTHVSERVYGRAQRALARCLLEVRAVGLANAEAMARGVRGEVEVDQTIKTPCVPATAPVRLPALPRNRVEIGGLIRSLPHGLQIQQHLSTTSRSAGWMQTRSSSSSKANNVRVCYDGISEFQDPTSASIMES
jgi:hypothetical protein